MVERERYGSARIERISSDRGENILSEEERKKVGWNIRNTGFYFILFFFFCPLSSLRSSSSMEQIERDRWIDELDVVENGRQAYRDREPLGVRDLNSLAAISESFDVPSKGRAVRKPTWKWLLSSPVLSFPFPPTMPHVLKYIDTPVKGMMYRPRVE